MVGGAAGTDGVDSDFIFLADHVRLSLEAWDFNNHDPEMDRARLKLTGALSFLKYFYIQAGYDNILNRRVDALFVGGAIRFEDEDLKYLLGGASSLVF